MTEIATPTLVVFDLDETLYDYEKANSKASKILIQNLATATRLSEDAVSQALVDARRNVKRRLGSTASSHSRILYISEAFRILNLRPDPELFLQLEEMFWRDFMLEIELFVGVKEFLELVKEENIPLALVTDLTSNIQYRKLVKLGMVSCFDFILTSEEAGGDKSSGLPFEILDHSFMHIPKNSWFIGDSRYDSPKILKNDVFFFKKVKQRDKFCLGNVIEFENFDELSSLV